MKHALNWALPLIGAALFILFMAGWQRDLDPADLQAKYANSDSQFIDVGDGVLVHVRDEGKSDAAVLVLIHGSGSSLQTWEPWIPRLAVEYRVVTLDLPGHGLTGPSPARDYSAKAYAKAIDELTRKLGAEKFVIAGHAMGGWIAWHYALAHPERTSGLILISPVGAPGIEAPDPPLIFRLGDYPGGRRLALFVTPRSFIEKGLKETVSVKSVITDKVVDRYRELLLYPGNRQATLDRTTVLDMEQATPAGMRQIEVPTLVMAGADDTAVPPNAANWFARAIPGAREIVYPGVGHIPMEEAPDKTSRDVLDFLNALAPPSQK